MAGSGYTYITLAQLRQQLLDRLQDSAGVNTPVAEANYYIAEALRVLNVQTNIWNSDYVLDFSPGDSWKSLNVPGSPRVRTITDSYLYSQMEAMLMEPMTGGVWTGTAMYDIALLSGALQFRRDELLLQSAANPGNLIQSAPALITVNSLPDSTLGLARVRWIPQDSSMPYVLGREDADSVNAFGPLLGIEAGPPDSWMITVNQPLQFSLSSPPNQPGLFDMLISWAGTPLSPPAPTLISLPDDWTWVALYGALADVLANSPEGRDAERAKYCLSRYEHGIKAMLNLPWLLEASIESIPVDTPSFNEMDAWAQNWEQSWPQNDPQIVAGGVDFVALAPFATSAQVSSVITVVGNAPIPLTDSAYVQITRDGVDAVLNYAQHVASFKLGGADFAATFPLYEQFESYCRKKNAQYAALGIFRAQTLQEGNRSAEVDPRFEKEVRDRNGEE